MFPLRDTLPPRPAPGRYDRDPRRQRGGFPAVPGRRARPSRGQRLRVREAEELAGLLSAGTWIHAYPLSFDRSRELGLRVSSDIPQIFMDLIGLRPQPVRRQPTVEYLPGPRRRDVAASGERK